MSDRYGLTNFRATQAYPNPKLAEIPNSNPVVYGNWQSGGSLLPSGDRLAHHTFQPTTLRPAEMPLNS